MPKTSTRLCPGLPSKRRQVKPHAERLLAELVAATLTQPAQHAQVVTATRTADSRMAHHRGRLYQWLRSAYAAIAYRKVTAPSISRASSIVVITE